MTSPRDWEVTLEAEEDIGGARKPEWYCVRSDDLGIDLEIMDWPSQEGVRFEDGEEAAAHVVKDILNRALSAYEWAGLALSISRTAHEAPGAEDLGHITELNGFCPACHAIHESTMTIVSTREG